MKFLQSEYDTLKTLIDSSHLEYKDFSFVKKKGAVHIQYDAALEPFVYFRKKETVIENGRFVDSITFLLGKSKTTEVSVWEEVLERFGEWLAGCQ